MKEYKFFINMPEDYSAGMNGFTDVVTISFESGDPGGDDGEFEDWALGWLPEWYDGARVSLIDDTQKIDAKWKAAEKLVRESKSELERIISNDGEDITYYNPQVLDLAISNLIKARSEMSTARYIDDLATLGGS